MRVDCIMTDDVEAGGRAPKLFVIATPIGNLEDVTLRALRVLGEIDVLACEDTRVTRRLFERHGISRPAKTISYHEHNEEKAGNQLVELLLGGATVGLCSDGGMPGVSDPGYRLIVACIEAGIDVEIIPGASAAQMALVASGLSTSSYTFKGFPPRKPGPRKRFLEADKDLPHTLVIYESPHRVGKLLDAALEVLGNRRAAVCVELTKKFERVHRGTLTELAEQYGEMTPKGEVTVVIAGNNPKFLAEDEDG